MTEGIITDQNIEALTIMMKQIIDASNQSNRELTKDYVKQLLGFLATVVVDVDLIHDGDVVAEAITEAIVGAMKPSGQRPQDLVKFAKEILDAYPEI